MEEEEETGRGANYQELQRFQTRDEFEQWWENQWRDWSLFRQYTNSRGQNRRYYLCRGGPNGRGSCPARLRVVIRGQLHVVANTPDRPHQHPLGLVDNLRTPRTTYQEIMRTGVLEHLEEEGWWDNERANWQYEPRATRQFDSGWEHRFYRCRGHNQGGHACPARLRIARAPNPQDLVTYAISSVPHNH